MNGLRIFGVASVFHLVLIFFFDGRFMAIFHPFHKFALL